MPTGSSSCATDMCSRSARRWRYTTGRQNAFVAGFIGSPEMNLVEADLKNGFLSLSADVSIPAGSDTGEREVIAGIRPEAITISDEGPEFAVRGIEQLGSQTLFIGETAGHRLRVMTSAGTTSRLVRAFISLFPQQQSTCLTAPAVNASRCREGQLEQKGLAAPESGQLEEKHD